MGEMLRKGAVAVKVVANDFHFRSLTLPYLLLWRNAR
jgi:hypothetical protein